MSAFAQPYTRATIERKQQSWWQTFKEWRYFDIPFFAFFAATIACATMTAHGTLTFYQLIMIGVWAWVATFVIAFSIPLLELALMLDKYIDKQGKERVKKFYLIGFVVILSLEALAQYFQAQAPLIERIQARFPDAAGRDLATFAQEPHGRILVIAYVALFTVGVVFFGYAASSRYTYLRDRKLDTVTDRVEYETLLKDYVKQENDLRIAQAALEQANQEVERQARALFDASQQLQYSEPTKADLDDAEIDALVCKALASGNWTVKQQAAILTEMLGSERKAAEALDTSPQNVNNWIKAHKTQLVSSN